MRYETPLETRYSWFHTPSATEQLLGAWPVTAGVSEAKPGSHHSGRPLIPYFSLHIILSGAVRFRLGDSDWTYLGPGDLFCVFPQTKFEYGACPDRPLPRRTWLALDGPAAANLIDQLSLSVRQPVIRGMRSRPFAAISRHIESSFDEASARRPLKPIEYFASFVGEVIGQVSSSRRAGEQDNDWLRRGRELIDSRFNEPITITDIADEIGVDRSQFTKAFSRDVGVPPATYLTQRRMEHSRELLQNSRLSVTDVAYAVGYTDVYTFSRSFRRQFGSPPSSYRQR